MAEQNKLIVFEDRRIRRTWHNEEWWYVVTDIVEVLTDSKNPSNYIKDMRRRDAGLSAAWKVMVILLTVETKGGKQRMSCSNTKGIFRIIQSIPSQKAEPFKQWLAKVGYERIQEIEDPALAAERARQYYQDLGYSDDWISKRLQSIEVRGELTDEWKKRNIKEGLEYAILTSEISKATFGMSPKEYKEHKNLKKENLRDHMTNLELIFTMLGEESTKQEAVSSDAKGLEENKKAAIKGGTAAGKALEAYEQQTGLGVTSKSNFKHQIAEAKKEQKRLRAEKMKIDNSSEEE